MKTLRLCALALVACATSILAGPRFPAREGDINLRLVSAFSIDYVDPLTADLCSVGCTGTIKIHRGVPTGDPPPHKIPIEILQLALKNVGKTVASVGLGVASVGSQNGGEIIGGAVDDFPAHSFFDVFVEISVGGQTLINTQAAHMVQGGNFQNPAALASFFDIFLCTQPVPLFDKANPGVQVATLASLWMRPCAVGNEVKHGVSIDINGQSTLGKLTYSICPDAAEPSAVVDVKPETLLGDITSNTECDEVFVDLGLGQQPAGSKLKFEAVWDRNVRVPDWRGFHKGKFRIYLEIPGAKPKVIATGRLGGTHGVGTHRAPLPAPHDGEDCHDCSHFEGALSGLIRTGTFRGKLEATYAGVYLNNAGQPVGCCPPPPIPPTGNFVVTLDGVAVTKCLPMH